MSLDECMRKAAITGGTVGAVAGAILGGLLTGPLWFLGAIAGGVLGANAGGVIGILICLATDKGDGAGQPPVSFARPRFTNLRLSAQPNPAKVGQPCSVNIHYTVEGNDDRVLLEITWEFTVEAGNPGHPPSWLVRNNASVFGRAVTGQTSWDQPHDGRLVEAEITLVATRGTERYVLRETVPSIRVPVQP